MYAGLAPNTAAAIPPPASTARRGPDAWHGRRTARARRRTAARWRGSSTSSSRWWCRRTCAGAARTSKLKLRCFSCSSRMPPCPCTMGFGNPVVPGGEQDPQRMIERHLLEDERRRAAPAARSISRPSAARRASPCTVVSSARAHESRAAAWSARRRRPASCSSAVEHPAAMAIARDAEEHLGIELRETIEHAARAEVRPAARPRSRRCSPWPASRRRLPACSAGRRRRDRRASRRARAAGWRARAPGPPSSGQDIRCSDMPSA